MYIGRKKEYSKKNYAMYLMNKNIRFYNGTYQIFYSTIYPIDPPNPPEVNRNWRKYNLTLFDLQSAKIILVHPNYEIIVMHIQIANMGLFSIALYISITLPLCDSNICRSFLLLKVIVKRNDNLIAISSKKEKEHQLSLIEKKQRNFNRYS